jgi:hypothetical protein
MKIFLKILTGQGITLQGKLDLSDLPEDLAQRARKILQEPRLSAAARAESNPLAVDTQEYELMIISEDQNIQPEKYLIPESDDNADVLDVLDDLMHEIVLQKKGLSGQSK